MKQILFNLKFLLNDTSGSISHQYDILVIRHIIVTRDSLHFIPKIRRTIVNFHSGAQIINGFHRRLLPQRLNRVGNLFRYLQSASRLQHIGRLFSTIAQLDIFVFLILLLEDFDAFQAQSHLLHDLRVYMVLELQSVFVAVTILVAVQRAQLFEERGLSRATTAQKQQLLHRKIRFLFFFQFIVQTIARRLFWCGLCTAHVLRLSLICESVTEIPLPL
mmetsp:Transcript_729/g.1395  ORF Transcript_729/g.1395 Transcript_729/m.1395 type:complete len:218 (+) Transcript_729:982-1635(+)